MNTRTLRFGGTRAQLLALATLAPVSYLHAANGTWNTNGPGNWSDTTKWTGGVVASGASTTADFSTIDITGDHVITVDQPFTVGTLKVGDITTLSNSYTFAGAGPLILDNGGSQPVLNIVNRTPTLSTPLSGTNGISKTGDGLITLSGNNSGLSGVLNLQNPGATNTSGVILASDTAIGGITTINVNGVVTPQTGQYLGLSGGVTLATGVTINLNSIGGNNAPPGALRSEGTNTVVNTINGPINVTMSGARISNNTAKRLDINGVISGGINNIVFRNASNEGIHLTNTGNNWTGPTTHSGGSLWIDPGTLPATTNLQISASDAGTIQTNGTFSRALGVNAGEAQFILGATRPMGFGARGGALTVNFGGAGAEVFFDSATATAPTTIRSNILVLNGSTADNKITLVNPININGAARTIQTDTNVAELTNGIRGGAFSITKAGAGTLNLPAASTWTGDLVIGNANDSNLGGIVRVTNPDSLGPAATAKNVNAMGLNRGTSIVELSGGVSIDNKTLRMWGKNLAMNAAGTPGFPQSLRSVSGNNAWNGNIVIANSGGAYAIESQANTLTLGSSPATTSFLRNEVATSSRPMFFYGPGNFVVNTKIADNVAMNTGLNNSGVGTLSVTRADNDFDMVPNLYAGTTEIVSLTAGGSPSSLGVASSLNLGATLRYIGAGDTSDRSIALMPTGATLDASGTGPLVLSSPVLTHSTGITASVVAAFPLGATSLVINDAAGIAVGQTITGAGIAANTKINAVDVTTRTITLSLATTAASTNNLGENVTLANVPNVDRTLTFTGSNTGNNSLAAPLTNSNPGILSVVKNGAGKWTLNGVGMTYTGSTAINQGTLGFDGGLPNLNTLTVNPAATLALGNVSLTVNPATGRALDIDGSLLLTGPVNIALPQAAPSGTQTILEYASGSGGANLVSNYRGTTFNMGATSATATTTPGSGAVLTWTGAGDNLTWDTKLTQNWKTLANVPQSFFWGDSVRFDDSSPTSFISLSGELRPASITIDSTNLEFTFDGTGGFLSGPASLTKTGSAKVFLGGANTLSGGISILNGQLVPTTLQALGAPGNDITVASGAQLDINGTMTVSRDYDLTIAGTGADGTGAVVNNIPGALTTGVASLTLTANATIGGSGRWDVRPTPAATGAVNLAGFTLTKLGSNFMGLVDSSLGDGTINVNAGTLAFTRLTDSGVGAVNVAAGASVWFENYTTGIFTRPVNLTDATLHFQSTGNFPISSALTLTGSPTLEAADAARAFTVLGDVSGSGNLLKTLDGNLILAGNNTWAGTTTISAGTLTIGNQNNFSTLTSAPVVDNGTLGINRSDNTYVVANAISGTGKLSIGQTTGAFDSLVTLTGANTFSGDITVQSGGLKIFNASALGTGPKKMVLTNGTNGRPQFYLDGSSGNITTPADLSFDTSSTNLPQPAIGNLAGDNVVQGNITLNSGGGGTAISVFGGTLSLNGGIAANTSNRRLIVGGTAGSGTVNGVISNGTNPLGLDKMDPITWTLTGANTYTGTTVISAGTLLVNGNQSTASGAISVAAGATLGGSGTLGGATTAAASSTIAPGSNGIGTLSTAAPVSIAGNLAIEVNSSSADRLTVSGSLDLTGSSLTVTTLAAPTQPAYVIASYGLLTGTFTTVTGVPSGYVVNYNYNNANQIALVQGSADAYGSFETANGISGAGSNVDSDKDGIPNGIEFVIGGDPSGPGSDSNALLPTATVTATHVNFVFRRTDASASYNPVAEYSTTLNPTWTTAQNGVNGVVITTDNDAFGAGIDRVTVAIPRTLAIGSRIFVRLKVNIP